MKHPSPWLVGGAICVLVCFYAWSQDEAFELFEPVSKEDADAAAMELANGLDFGIDEGDNEQAEPEPTPSAPPQAPTVAPMGPGMPLPVTDADFEALRSSSPFTRALDLSDSLILTGIAKIGDETIATLADKKTKETYVVSAEANAQGWRMVEVQGDQSDLERVTAKIVVTGGEVISVRFDENQLKPGEAKPAAGPGGGDGRGDGRGRRGPPEDMRRMFSQLSDDQRRKLFAKVHEIRKKNPNMTREQMGDMIRKMGKN